MMDQKKSKMSVQYLIVIVWKSWPVVCDREPAHDRLDVYTVWRFDYKEHVSGEGNILNMNNQIYNSCLRRAFFNINKNKLHFLAHYFKKEVIKEFI